jgi:UDP-3-O-[3-hydroxymyristoyl] glucosamine N-acyltransferase
MRGTWRMMGKEWDAASIVSDLERGYYTEGPQRTVTGVSSILEAGEDDLAFCAWDDEKGISSISNSNAGIILCKNTLKGQVTNSRSQLVFLDNPRFVFVHFVNRARNLTTSRSISSSAMISQSAQLGDNCQVGPFVTIGDGCVIGNNAVIEDRVTLRNCSIGNNCVVQSGVTIGSEGFAYERDPCGRLERFPHLAGVVIGDEVEISANVSIARGSLTDTLIGDETKLDALVHIAHNVRIGTRCQLAAGTIIGGSTQLGDSCWTGLNSTLKNTIKVGNRVLVAAGACVIGDVADDDIVAGVPAKSIKQKVTTGELYLMTGRQSGQS